MTQRFPLLEARANILRSTLEHNPDSPKTRALLKEIETLLQNYKPTILTKAYIEAMLASVRTHDPEYSDRLTRYLQAKRDFPGLDVGPEPVVVNDHLRAEIIREFNRTS